MTPEQMGPALLGVSISVQAASTFLPDLVELHQSAPSPQLCQAVRLGEVAAAGLIIGTGVAVSSLMRAPVAAALSVVAAVGLLAIYEYALRDVAGGARKGA